MGEEAGMVADYGGATAAMADDNKERVREWEDGLPTADDLTPLSQTLIPPELASAFSISPEPTKTLLDVHRASQSTVSSLRHQVRSNSSSATANIFPTNAPPATVAAGAGSLDRDDSEPVVEEEEERGGKEGGISVTTESSKKARAGGSDEIEDFDSGSHGDYDPNSNPGRPSKKPRLAWTPQLHKRFVDAVAHLGLKNAVPSTIMQLMNVEGLSRENVASHLQKYRLYLKRMQGTPEERPSSSTPPPPADKSCRQRAAVTADAPSPMPYVSVPAVIPVPFIGIAHHPYATLGEKTRGDIARTHSDKNVK